MVVGDDISVRTDNKATAGTGGFHCLAEDVGAGSGSGIDGHHRVHGGGVDFSGLHLGLAVYLLHRHGDRGPVTLLEGDRLPGGTAIKRRAAEAAAGTDDGAGQHNGDHLCRRAFEEALLLPGPLLRGNAAAGGLIVVGGQIAVAAIVILIVMEAIKFIVIHHGFLLYFRSEL